MRRAAGLIALLLIVLVALPSQVQAQDVVHEQPNARAELGLGIAFDTGLQSANRPQVVELVIRRPGQRAVTVLPAALSGGAGQWRAEAELEGHVAPNTRLLYRFRSRDTGGALTLGPEAEVVVGDDRFDWRTVEGSIVRLHWYHGDEGFARRALEIGETAVATASELLGVVETEPIDFFIYDSEEALRGALGPGTRENVGGQAHADIRTMFGLITPGEVNSPWVDTLVIHELTHLVFDTATDNPYHTPPRWLNEGVAVYLSEGYGPTWRSAIDAAVAERSIIPLDGLGGMFPTTRDQFFLAYAESVSAVDFFIAEYGEPTLWQLVRSYAQGVSDDEAFRAATGAGLAEFNAAWMASLGLGVPEPLGPRPGLPGPVPSDWAAQPGVPPATLAPGATPGVPATPTDQPEAPAPEPSPPGGEQPADDGLLVGLLAAVLVVGGLALAGLLVGRRLLP